MRGLGSALELLRTSRSDDQQRATRVGLATNGAQRHAHELAHAPSESGARHSRDLRGGPRECEVDWLPLLAICWSLNHARERCFSGSPRSVRLGTLGLGHERADAPRPFEATWRARNPRRARPESRSPRRCAHAWRRCLLFAGRPDGIDQGTHDRHARARPHPQLHMRKGVNRNPSGRPDG